MLDNKVRLRNTRHQACFEIRTLKRIFIPLPSRFCLLLGGGSSATPFQPLQAALDAWRPDGPRATTSSVQQPLPRHHTSSRWSRGHVPHNSDSAAIEAASSVLTLSSHWHCRRRPRQCLSPLHKEIPMLVRQTCSQGLASQCDNVGLHHSGRLCLSRPPHH